jgi:hypothetical protein
MFRIGFDKLQGADLVVDAVYESNRDAPAGALAGEPLNRLMKVGNLGGFRPRSGNSGILFSVITSTGSEAAWPDSLDPYSGVYTYYGDNRSPGQEMHATKQRGNALLRDAFELAHSGEVELRKRCPVFFIFEWAGNARDHVFRGMAVPGSSFLAPGEDLVAVWRTIKGERFQNYRASLTVLDEASISGSWLQDSISAGEFLLEDERAPKAYKSWVKSGKLSPLVAEKIGTRSVQDQIPERDAQVAILKSIYDRCSSDPWLFERVAAEVWKMSSPTTVEYELTRRYRDGGRDAIGSLLVGPASDPIKLTFALEAKLYKSGNTVGVKEVSRLISRIKHREFGVFVTTSAINSQAYKEIRDDQHPIVVISGRDVVEILSANGITTISHCHSWLESVLSTE